MATAPRNTLIAACAAAIGSTANIAPNTRLYLARASLHADAKGRTNYGPARYAADTGDSFDNGEAAITQLLALDLACHDHNDDGIECWRLTHFDWEKRQVISGEYHPNAGQPRDGLPPQYSRTVADVIEPNGKKYHPPAGTSWRELAEEQA